MDRREEVVDNVLGFFLEGEVGYEDSVFEVREAVEDSSDEDDEFADYQSEDGDEDEEMQGLEDSMSSIEQGVKDVKLNDVEMRDS